MQEEMIEVGKGALLITESQIIPQLGGQVCRQYQLIKHVVIKETGTGRVQSSFTGYRPYLSVYALDIGKVNSTGVTPAGEYDSTEYQGQRIIGPGINNRALLKSVEPLTIFKHNDLVEVGKITRRLGSLSDIPPELQARTEELISRTRYIY